MTININQQATKSCEFCGEEILEVAIKCKHCGSMLDGSQPTASGVVVKGIDPFANYHTDIQGKKDGKITVLGYAGIGIGLLIVIVAFSTAISNVRSDDFSFDVFILSIATMMFGVFFTGASYLWARRK